MAYKFNNISLSTYGITASHAPLSNISMQGCYDLPKRTGITFKDWGDTDGVEAWVAEDEIMFEGRDIKFYATVQGTVSGMNGYLSSFYNTINAATGLSVLETPYNSASGYVKSVMPVYMNGGAKVAVTFREPVVSLTGTLPASGVGANTIDSIPFSSFGLYLSKTETFHDLPELKDQFFTKYGEEGYQIVKRKNKTLDIDGFITGSSIADFNGKIEALYKIFSSSGTRTIVIDNTTVIECFATEGFKVSNMILYNLGMIAKFNISLIVISDTYE